MTEVRAARVDELPAVAALLCRFNTEFDDLVPDRAWLTQRLAELSGEDLTVLVARPGPDGSSQDSSGPDGLVVLRYRPDLWTAAPECYLAELYVVPERRGHGLGRALLDAAIAHARSRGASRIELGTSEDDVAARALYSSAGFVNTEGPGGPTMYVYELELG